MKKSIISFFAMVLVASLFFSFVHAEPSNPVQNALAMKSPFSTGSHESDASHQGTRALRTRQTSKTTISSSG